MNLRQLHYFLTVLEAGSLGHAARRLGVAEPTLVHHLSILESEFSTPLLEGDPRAEPTPAGAVLAADARRILAMVEAARLDVAPLQRPFPATPCER